jgi:hypothetical protein
MKAFTVKYGKGKLSNQRRLMRFLVTFFMQRPVQGALAFGLIGGKLRCLMQN